MTAAEGPMGAPEPMPGGEPVGDSAALDLLAHEVAHWGHLLPSQGPMTTFVHHNTLHGLQHKPFEQAVAEAEAVLGGRAYEPVERSRGRYRSGRITDEDLDAALADRADLGPPEVIGTIGGRTVTDAAIRRRHMVNGVNALAPATLRYEVSEGAAARRFADDVGPAARARLLGTAQQKLGSTERGNGRDSYRERGGAVDLERDAVRALWQACLAAFDLAATGGAVTSPELVAEGLADAFTEIETSGGPSVRLAPATIVELRAAVEEVLASLRSAAEAEPKATPAADEREAASAAWFVLCEMSREGLSRRGVDALEALVELNPGATRVAALLAPVHDRDPRRSLARHLDQVVAEELDGASRFRTHAELAAALTGHDVVDLVNQYLIRRCAAFLDLGQAAWRMPDRPAGFYDAWRRAATTDHSLAVGGLRGWRDAAAALPARPDEAVASLLSDLGVIQDRWGDYVGRVLLGLPGWAGMMNWRGTTPGFARQDAQPADLMQYLAVRLFVESAVVRDVARRTWGVEPAELEDHLRARPAELWLRRELFLGRLPAFLAAPTRLLAAAPRDGSAWSELADKAWAWLTRTEARSAAGAAAHDHAWRLFRLAQLEGWSAEEVRGLPPGLRDRLLVILDEFPEADHRAIWLAAFERHYRQQILGALAANRGRGRWRTRDRRPRAQIVLCIDEREESFHRAIDEMDSEYETFGSGGFFGVAMDYTGLDDHAATPLCPAGVIPANRVLEVPREGTEETLRRHKGRRRWEEVFHNTYWEAKRNAVSALFLTQLFGLFHAIPLFGRVLAPRGYTELSGALDRLLVPTPATELTLDLAGQEAAGQAEAGKPLGFTVTEQADKVQAQLANIGMTYNFARLVVFCGHGSISVNNPHESAHDCGACGGKHGGPNGRAFAGLANRPAVRAELSQRGIDIPDDTHFIGAVHNTASDLITYFDTDAIPASHQEEWHKLHADLDEARARSARERCGRFASAPTDPTPAEGLRHVETRSRDLSQVRPEWGHCTNAFAVVGRRSLTQGAFFDRRGFVISYDPTQDPTGAIVERILMTVGPVGAGINLEYYFSSVDNRYYGCDTKVPHNVSGLLGVMEGAASDLRTGLPRQMIEIHEPMRLLLIVESTLEILGGIYGKQPAIAELLDNAWVHLVAMNPDDGRFHRFVPGQGFVEWEEVVPALPTVELSHDYYQGRTDFLSPVLIGPRS